MPLSRRFFLTSLLNLFSISTVFGKNRMQSARRPNIIYIMADDLGWADLSCYGRKEYQTVALDELARGGVKFMHAYSASPVCTPTRCAFTTGKYPARTPVGLKEPLSWKKNIGDTIGLDPSVPTIASLLKKNGYHTALIGKWHLGYLPKYSPIKSGYDDFFGLMSGGVDYFTHKDALGEPDLFEDEVPVEKNGYITDLITERAVAFVSGKHDKPFFLSLNYNAPHWPWEGPQDEAKSAIIKSWVSDGGSDDVYASMMRSLDEGIGKVISALRKNKLENDTMIIFTSDNGGERFSNNWPFSGEKLQLLEGGIRVPAILYWKGVIPAGQVTNQVAITMDWTRTILAAAGVTDDAITSMDGEDLLPVVTKRKAEFERKLFWKIKDQRAVRNGKWKYYTKIERLKDCAEEREYLFDLSFDQREKSDFKKERPEILAELKGYFENWDKDMLKHE